MITNEGLTYLLEVGFRGGAQLSSWYVGLIGDSSFTGLDEDDTAATHSGWTESTAYAEATRPQWSPPAASGEELVNSSVIQFTMNAAATINGVFLASSSTKSGTAGKLCEQILFDTPQVMPSGEVLKILNTLLAQSAGG